MFFILSYLLHSLRLVCDLAARSQSGVIREFDVYGRYVFGHSRRFMGISQLLL